MVAENKETTYLQRIKRQPARNSIDEFINTTNITNHLVAKIEEPMMPSIVIILKELKVAANFEYISLIESRT